MVCTLSYSHWSYRLLLYTLTSAWSRQPNYWYAVVTRANGYPSRNNPATSPSSSYSCPMSASTYTHPWPCYFYSLTLPFAWSVNCSRCCRREARNWQPWMHSTRERRGWLADATRLLAARVSIVDDDLWWCIHGSLWLCTEAVSYWSNTIEGGDCDDDDQSQLALWYYVWARSVMRRDATSPRRSYRDGR
jgi:hypothetical protein